MVMRAVRLTLALAVAAACLLVPVALAQQKAGLGQQCLNPSDCQSGSCFFTSFTCFTRPCTTCMADFMNTMYGLTLGAGQYIQPDGSMNTDLFTGRASSLVGQNPSSGMMQQATTLSTMSPSDPNYQAELDRLFDEFRPLCDAWEAVSACNAAHSCWTPLGPAPDITGDMQAYTDWLMDARSGPAAMIKIWQPMLSEDGGGLSLCSMLASGAIGSGSSDPVASTVAIGGATAGVTASVVSAAPAMVSTLSGSAAATAGAVPGASSAVVSVGGGAASAVGGGVSGAATVGISGASGAGATATATVPMGLQTAGAGTASGGVGASISAGAPVSAAQAAPASTSFAATPAATSGASASSGRAASASAATASGGGGASAGPASSSAAGRSVAAGAADALGFLVFVEYAQHVGNTGLVASTMAPSFYRTFTNAFQFYNLAWPMGFIGDLAAAINNNVEGIDPAASSSDPTAVMARMETAAGRLSRILGIGVDEVFLFYVCFVLFWALVLGAIVGVVMALGWGTRPKAERNAAIVGLLKAGCVRLWGVVVGIHAIVAVNQLTLGYASPLLVVFALCWFGAVAVVLPVIAWRHLWRVRGAAWAHSCVVAAPTPAEATSAASAASAGPQAPHINFKATALQAFWQLMTWAQADMKYLGDSRCWTRTCRARLARRGGGASTASGGDGDAVVTANPLGVGAEPAGATAAPSGAGVPPASRKTSVAVAIAEPDLPPVDTAAAPWLALVSAYRPGAGWFVAPWFLCTVLSAFVIGSLGEVPGLQVPLLFGVHAAYARAVWGVKPFHPLRQKAEQAMAVGRLINWFCVLLMVPTSPEGLAVFGEVVSVAVHAAVLLSLLAAQFWSAFVGIRDLWLARKAAKTAVPKPASASPATPPQLQTQQQVPTQTQQQHVLPAAGPVPLDGSAPAASGVPAGAVAGPGPGPSTVAL